MTDFWSWVAGGAGNIVLAILAGAGGSALLELLWRPRRDRRRAAAFLVAEVAFNTELLIMQAHARKSNPKGIPGDLHFSTIGWEGAGDLISELPPKLLRELVLLYNRYRSLNQNIEAFAIALRERGATSPATKQREEAELHTDTIIDVFNTGIDATIEHGQALLPRLADMAGYRETDAEKRQAMDYATIVAHSVEERHRRIADYRRRFGNP